ncbi:hypothetical protein [Brevibacterium album]|uniref:hypothetical protein n=1 Tax=Brevibacterium album TaxID=417948 RepID=UPI0012EC3CB1|nr:hypothetical protein [Brevibacterium album]
MSAGTGAVSGPTGAGTEAPIAAGTEPATGAGAASGDGAPAGSTAGTPARTGRGPRTAMRGLLRGFLRGLRRWAVLIVVIALLLAAGAWAGTVHWQLQSARTAFAAGDHAAAESAGERFLELSPLERHKGHFAIGTARAAEGRLDEADAALARALELSPVADECAIRQNLAHVQEAQAGEFREAGDTDAANERFDAARTTLTEAPEECRPEGSAQDEQMDEQEQGVDEAQEAMNRPEQTGGEGSGEDEGEGAGDGQPDEGDGGEQYDAEEGADGAGGDEDSQGAGSGGAPDTQPGQTSEDERLDELRERRRASEEEYAESNSGEGSGVRGPGVKPW